MNPKLKNILANAWNEPRHFFFWLTLLGVVGFAFAMVITAFLNQPVGVLQFFALGCAACVPVGLLAFFLSWIPPVRRLFAWLLQRRWLVLAGIVTLIALGYAVENWRGNHAWTQFRREGEAHGERFTLADMIPPPVPDDQNFFESPIWEGMHYTRTNGDTVWRDTNSGSRVLLDVHGPNGQAAPKNGGFANAERVDLSAWQEYYRGTNNVFAALPGGSNGAVGFTNYFPIARAAQAPAVDVLLALSKFEENRQLLRAAAARPQARFWINYEDGFSALLPHLAKMKSTAAYLSLHAVASLKADENLTALEDVKLSFRLAEAVHSEPFLISYLVRIALLQITLQPVLEGLADHQWTATELAVIESELGRLDLLADYHLAMRGERAFSLWAVDYVRRRGAQGFNELGGMEESASAPAHGDLLGKTLGTASFALIPSGWFDQNKLSLARMQANYILPLVNREQRLVSPATARQTQALIEDRSPLPAPYDLFSRMLLPALTRTAEKAAWAQTSVDLARVAIALERYRLAHGKYPETLDALAPQFMAKLPHDVINGQPLKYRRTDDASFVLYSVGWNEQDDGGTVALYKSGKNIKWKEGDWVWRYPAK